MPDIPGHKEHLTEANAWTTVKKRLDDAITKGSRIKYQQRPEYHKFPKGKFPAGSTPHADVIVMTVPLDVPVPKQADKTKPLYFGVELDSATTITPVDEVTIKPAAGRFTVTYKVNGQQRKAVVWRK
jgi:hypothetical protein